MTMPTTKERRLTDAPQHTGPVWPAQRIQGPTQAGAELHLLTYVVGNLLFWTLWGAISLSTDHWYWWPILPLAGWTAVLALHLWLAHRKVIR